MKRKFILLKSELLVATEFVLLQTQGDVTVSIVNSVIEENN